MQNCGITRLFGFTLDSNNGLAGDIWVHYWADGWNGAWAKSLWTDFGSGTSWKGDEGNWDGMIDTRPRDGVWHVCIVPEEGSWNCVSNMVDATTSFDCEAGVQVVQVVFRQSQSSQTSGPTPNPSPAPTQLPPSTPSALHPAPVLLEPGPGARFNASEDIVLKWQWEGRLAENEYFDVRVWLEGHEHLGVAWTKDIRYPIRPYSMPARLRPQAAEYVYHWAVAVVRGADGILEQVVSPESSSSTILVRER